MYTEQLERVGLPPRGLVQSEVAPPALDIQIAEITRQQIPLRVLSEFEKRSIDFVPPRDYRLGNFAAYYRLAHPNGDQMFAARQVKEYIEGEPEELTYFLDVDAKKEIVARGEIRRPTLEDQPPFIGFIGTDGEKRKGLATRLLTAMNTFSKGYYGATLISGDTRLDGPRFFERLVEKGMVVRCVVGGKAQYRLL